MVKHLGSSDDLQNVAFGSFDQVGVLTERLRAIRWRGALRCIRPAAASERARRLCLDRCSGFDGAFRTVRCSFAEPANPRLLRNSPLVRWSSVEGITSVNMLRQPARLRTHSSLLIGVLQVRATTCGHQCKGHAQSRTRLHHGVDASSALSVLASGSGYYCCIVSDVQEREFLRAWVIARSCGVAPDGARCDREAPRVKRDRWADEIEYANQGR